MAIFQLEPTSFRINHLHCLHSAGIAVCVVAFVVALSAVRVCLLLTFDDFELVKAMYLL